MKYEGMHIDTDFSNSPIGYTDRPSKEEFSKILVEYALTIESEYEMMQVISYRDNLYEEKAFVILLSEWHSYKERYEKDRLDFLCDVPDIIRENPDADICYGRYQGMRVISGMRHSMDSLQLALDSIVGCCRD